MQIISTAPLPSPVPDAGRKVREEAGIKAVAGVMLGAVLGFFTLTGMAATVGVVALSWSGTLTW